MNSFRPDPKTKEFPPEAFVFIDGKLKAMTRARLETGQRYARWAVFDEIISDEALNNYCQELQPDNYFRGTACSKAMTVLMFLPYF
jgi:hypothetical protein